MRSARLILPAFLVLAFAQLGVPSFMIVTREIALRQGREFKFRAAPVDPSDPFRGKYLTLDFDANSAPVDDPKSWENAGSAWAMIGTDSTGFAKVTRLVADEPVETNDYIRVRIDYVPSIAKQPMARIQLPFERFYMDEADAPEGERVYNRAMVDTAATTWAVVKVRNGTAVLTDVMIDGVPLRQLIRRGPRQSAVNDAVE